MAKLKTPIETKEQALEEAVKVMTASIMELIEPCVRKRLSQFAELVLEYKNNKQALSAQNPVEGEGGGR